jgi:hypothetical protein
MLLQRALSLLLAQRVSEIVEPALARGNNVSATNSPCVNGERGSSPSRPRTDAHRLAVQHDVN